MCVIHCDKTPGTYVCNCTGSGSNFDHTQTDLTGFGIDLAEVARFMKSIHKWDE